MKQKKQTILWSMQPSTGTPVSYILGTMHLRDERIFGVIPNVEARLRQCSAFATEIRLDHTPAATSEDVFLIPNGGRIQDYISDKKFAKLRRSFQRSFDIDILGLQRYLPLVVANMAAEQVFQQDAKQPLDAHLWAMASGHGLTLNGIESFQEQAQILRQIPMRFQIQNLLDIGRNTAKFRRNNERLMAHYTNGRIDLLYKHGKRSLGPLRKILLYHRNAIMSRRMIEMATVEPYFFAIGAGHLAGGKGVLRMLAARGVRPKPIPLPMTVAHS